MSDLTRRDVVASALATGFALAVQPVTAQTITTDSKGLVSGEVKIPVKDVELPAYRSQPEKGGPFPVVLVIQEIFGVHEHIKDLTRRFAKAGYLAIAPELYVRQGDVSKVADIKDIRPIVAKVPDAQVLSDLDAVVEWARASGKGDVSRLSITGFCWGGRIVWLYSAHNPKLKAGAAWYGRLVGDRTELQPKYPVDVAADVKAPVLGLYGGKDQGIPLTTVDEMREALKKSKVTSEIVVYPEAQHAFNADYRPSYSAPDAQDAWKKMLAWFETHGAGPKKS